MEETYNLALINLEIFETKLKEKIKFMWKNPQISPLGNLSHFSNQVPDLRNQLLSVTALATIGL
ncbi:hypothetical protein A7K93_09220 [Candidatus Methylacidiphilum fumarolicum]|uniref:Uncharacterized protein n=2 Tax=Candidatus Methylacidiphilum fumarolicum TaxID=591154 RepID=I0JZE9_METFB|nr:hypothetical protein [Candidatus Methylacidiphilum fumarolicum]MBW6415775.1 hypothetical protein [Candidatus Methylacidiphilum fumarolicum]TFE66834.1 hypothetical protein A7K73_09765 [Candidatus Methylacidiphilum fumarolicum]TFE72271.1 hypothetical protein A7K93_09220 [Candidatus Methylacidiphilum fumarolicum]TFE72490.1 hypothetical protein A7K72_08535 [Candidatus Methylacidiphilum fumarolicum]TFE77663.1 hypothetical protein A7D33_03665 [Candidatus Methylacidiphilum fumarolicum]